MGNSDNRHHNAQNAGSGGHEALSPSALSWFLPPPPRDDLVLRSAVLAGLRAADRPIVCLTAPAGYGKTTVLTQWAAADPRSFAWISLDTTYDDPMVFAGQLTAALARTQPAGAGSRAVFTVQEPGFSTVVLPALAQQIREITEPFVLVLDDVHLIQDPAAVRLLEQFIMTVPPGSQVAMSARSVPSIAIGRLRVEGRLYELSAAELALTPGEAHGLLATSGIVSAAADAVVEAAEGWPVGVYLAGLALQSAGRSGDDETGTAEVAGFDGSDRTVVDYLESEFWSEVDDATMDFLIRTSVLTELTGPLCDAVLGQHGSGATLRRLRTRNHLVVPMDTHDRRFRYHHLLLDALRAELERREADLIPVLCDRASHWFEDRGDLDSAVRYARTGGDLIRTADLVWRNIHLAVGSGPTDTLHRWLDGVSDRDVGRSPELAAASAWVSLMDGDIERMDRWIVRAQALVVPAPDERDRDREVRTSLDLLRALRGDAEFAGISGLSRAAYASVPPTSQWRAFACFMAGIGDILIGEPQQAAEQLRLGETLATAMDMHLSRADCLATLGLLAINDGRLAEGADLVTRARDILVDHQLQELATSAYTMSVVAVVQARASDSAAARSTVLRARRLTAALVGLAPWFQVLGRTLLATASLHLKDVGTSRQLAREARQLLDTMPRSDYLEQAVVACETLLAGLPADQAAVGTSPLTTAELRVLQYLPTHLSFPEIASGLFVSRHTVKTQALAIYHKFGVTSRNEAVDRARELGLLPLPMMGSVSTAPARSTG